MRRAVLSAAVAAVVAASVVVLPGPVLAASAAAGSAELGGVGTVRYGGADRYETSLLIAEAVAAEAGGSLSSVVVVSGERWTDAVVAAPIAGSLGAAVLMTPPGELRADALEFLKRTGVTRAVVIGPEAGGGAHGSGRGVEAAVLGALGDAGIAAERVVGADRFATSVAAAREVTAGVMSGLGRTAVVASGEVFADALVAGPFAARGVHPVLLSAADELPAGVASYLGTSGIDHVVVMGGTAALSADVERAITDLGVAVTRIAGTTRYDTAVKAAELVAGRYSNAAGQDCFATSTVGLARARVPFDSFSAAPLLGRLCAPLVLADPRQIPADTAAFLDAARTANATVDLRVFGGDAAVSQTAIDAYLAGEDTSEPDEGEAVPVALPAGICGGSISDAPSQFLDSDRAEDASWAPDCSKIVYTEHGSLWTANVDGSASKLLVPSDSDYLSQAAWSPDGSRIAYARGYWDGINWRLHLWIVNADGSGKTKLSRGDVQERWPAWSPDGTRIVFEHVSGSGRDADGFFVNADRYIVTMDADGRDREVLRRGGHSEESPAWSPDGELLAFTSLGSVQVSEVDGSNGRAIIGGGYWNGGLSFSPDGRRIAFVRGDGTRSAIHVANVDGTDEQVIFDRDVQAVAPRWSPDGQRILFHTIDDENRRRIYVAGASGDPVRDTAAQCKPRGLSQHIAVGFPLPARALASTGTLRVAVLFIDFPDARATHTTHEEAALGLPYAEAYMEAVSDGKLDVQFVPHHAWLRADQPFGHYATLTTPTNQTSLSTDVILEAVALADDYLDFSDIDVALAVFVGTHFTAGASFGASGEADGSTFTLAAVGNEIRPVPGEPLDWGYVAAHELVHKFGLADYGPYDSSLHETEDPDPPGKSKVHTWWGLMQMHSWFYADSTDPRLLRTWRHRNGQTGTGYHMTLQAHEMLAWSRWQLGWLDESQVRCINDAEATVSLAPIAEPGDAIAMAAVPLNAREVIVIESRRKQGYDHSRDYTTPDGWSTTYPPLINEGVLVYTVDALTQTGELPLKVAGDTGNGQVDEFPLLEAGESVTVGGYTITVTADNGDTHTVSITKSN